MGTELKYFDRELSWLSFNFRVLEEAKDPSLPLYDQIRFLAIFSACFRPKIFRFLHFGQLSFPLT